MRAHIILPHLDTKVTSDPWKQRHTPPENMGQQSSQQSFYPPIPPAVEQPPPPSAPPLPDWEHQEHGFSQPQQQGWWQQQQQQQAQPAQHAVAKAAPAQPPQAQVPGKVLVQTPAIEAQPWVRTLQCCCQARSCIFPACFSAMPGISGHAHRHQPSLHASTGREHVAACCPAPPTHTGEGLMAQPCSQDSGDSTCGPAAPHVSVVWTADAMPHMHARHERARVHMCSEQRAESRTLVGAC